MRASNPLLKHIIFLLIYFPEKLDQFIKANNRNYIIKLIKQLLPLRIGMEIDVVGGEDNFICMIEEKCYTSNIKCNIERYSNYGLDVSFELKFSFITYKPLVTFKKVLDICYISNSIEGKIGLAYEGGLHIHIDRGTKQFNESFIIKFLKQYFYYIKCKIFDYHPPYHRPNKVSCLGSIKDHIHISSNHNTIEYRLAKPTFEYSKIIRWVLCCQQVNIAAITGNKFRKDICDIILRT